MNTGCTVSTAIILAATNQRLFPGLRDLGNGSATPLFPVILARGTIHTWHYLAPTRHLPG